MLIVQVYVKVNEMDIAAFIEETKTNASHSILENGIIRFDVQQNLEDPQQFLLTEIYTDAEAALDHKKTDHYGKWKISVAPMMAEPRYSVQYRNIYPE